MSVRLKIAALVLVVAASGCSAATAGPPAESRARAASAMHVPPPGEEARALAVPFDAYNFSPAEIMTIEAAQDLLIRDCMRGQGMEWRLLPLPAEADVEPPNRRRYGVIEPRIARLFGYHAPPDRPSVARYDTERNDRLTRLSPAARRAAYGDPGGDANGCSGEAEAHLAKDTQKVDASLFNTLVRQTFEESQRDGNVVRAFRAWSACMRNKGFPYPDPIAAVTDDRWLNTQQPSRQEIIAAEADVSCKKDGDLVATWAAAEERIQRDVVLAHAEYFRTLKTHKDRQLGAARRLLARG
ncbi:hypothetical protein [Nonomuraea rhodomycinica]|uniref:Uncharacterized protein n=1 Tax=Nonomuraea rhodomycinica TaxID=1712872 RepID=A0A7Y6IU21_9ACTN|nr:hypothetical protein [Nonomuraea rhodomycinica]NUW44392.1 hypothetical protein [Nonomuraea rhodomycinica]